MYWRLLKSTYAFVCPWLKVRKDHVRLSNGIELDDFYIVETANWVNVIAITEEGKFIIEEQYRHGVQRICYELPAGNVNVNEQPLEAAKRELIEETGYVSEEWIAFGQYIPNASGMNNTCHTFIAKNARKALAPRLEASEEIKIHLVDLSQLNKLLQTEKIVEAVMQAPLWRYISELE